MSAALYNSFKKKTKKLKIRTLAVIPCLNEEATIGSLVLLSNEQPARVVGNSGVAMKPIVRLISKNSDAGIIDLSKRNDIYIKDLYDKKDLKE